MQENDGANTTGEQPVQSSDAAWLLVYQEVLDFLTLNEAWVTQEEHMQALVQLQAATTSADLAAMRELLGRLEAAVREARSDARARLLLDGLRLSAGAARRHPDRPPHQGEREKARRRARAARGVQS